MNAGATWTLTDATGTVRCAQSAALSVPLGIGKTLRYRPRLRARASRGFPSAPAIATTSRAGHQPDGLAGSVTRRLDAADQCNPAGPQACGHAPTGSSSSSGGQFQLNALGRTPRSRRGCATRYGSGRGASPRARSRSCATTGPMRLIVVSDLAFQSICVHGRYPPQLVRQHGRVQDSRRVQHPPLARLTPRRGAQRTPQLRAVCGQGANPRVW